MAKRYDVVRHNEHTITLKQSGLLPNEVTIQRASITSVARKISGITVTTSAGKEYRVFTGVRDAQKRLVAEAFGLSL